MTAAAVAPPRAVSSVLMTADAVGGVWRYSIDLAAGLKRRGIATTLAVMGPSPTRAQQAEAAAAGASLEHRPYRLEWMRAPWADVRDAGVWLLDIARTARPDIVHVNGYAHAALDWPAPAIVVAHSCVRSWWTAVRGEPAPPRTGRYTAAVIAGLSAARAVVTPSAAMLAALAAEYDTVGAEAHVIPNGTARAPADGADEGKEPFVLTAGRLWDDAKNVSAVCSVAAQIRWPIYVAGDPDAPDGPARPLDGARALGRLDGAAMWRWFERASIYALPARYEPFGLSVLEAAAAGCALVLGDIDSLRENWEGAARFVPPDDCAALARTLQHLIDDDAGRRALMQRARARAAVLSIDRTADEYVRLYESVVA
jgi:glycosyltransferase involved in cell wall biosynthesis